MIDDLIRLFSSPAFASFATVLVTIVIQPSISHILKLREKRASIQTKLITETINERRASIKNAAKMIREIYKEYVPGDGFYIPGIIKLYNQFYDTGAAVNMRIYNPKIDTTLRKIFAHCSSIAEVGNPEEVWDTSRDLWKFIQDAEDQIWTTAEKEFATLNVKPHGYSPANGS